MIRHADGRLEGTPEEILQYQRLQSAENERAAREKLIRGSETAWGSWIAPLDTLVPRVYAGVDARPVATGITLWSGGAGCAQ